MSRKIVFAALAGAAAILQSGVAASAGERCVNYSKMDPGAFQNPFETPVRGGLIITYAFGKDGGQIVRQGDVTGAKADVLIVYFMKDHSTAYVTNNAKAQYAALSDDAASTLSVAGIDERIADFHLKDSPTNQPISVNATIADPFLVYRFVGDNKVLQKVCFNTADTMKVTSDAMIAMLMELRQR